MVSEAISYLLVLFPADTTRGGSINKPKHYNVYICIELIFKINQSGLEVNINITEQSTLVFLLLLLLYF